MQVELGLVPPDYQLALQSVGRLAHRLAHRLAPESAQLWELQSAVMSELELAGKWELSWEHLWAQVCLSWALVSVLQFPPHLLGLVLELAQMSGLVLERQC